MELNAFREQIETEIEVHRELAAINEKTFVLLVDEMPYFALHTMRNLVHRLRRMNEQWMALRPRVLSGF